MNQKHRRINIFNAFRIDLFKYFYMVVMVIYMAQMTEATSRMVGSLSGNPIPLLLPIFLTILLLTQNRIRWKCKNLLALLLLFFVWSLLVLVKLHSIASVSEWSYIFFLFYGVIIAFIHIRVYGSRLFPVYEHVMVQFSKICLVFWVLNIIFYKHSGFVSIFPDTGLGNSICYLYNWITPERARPDAWSITLRNSGCSWEPGRFAIMLALALFCNLSRRGLTLKQNSSAIWLLAALASTQSTTGYVIALFLLICFAVSKINMKNAIIFIAIVAPLTFFAIRLEFMESKIENQLDVDETSLQASFDYENSHLAEGTYIASLNRFEAMFFEWKNIANDHWLGYGRNSEHSYFETSVSSNYVLTGGILKVFGQYGVLLGLLIYVLLFVSSFRIASGQPFGAKIVLALTLIFSSVSYVIWCVPIFTAFWLYGIFANKKKYVAYRIVKDGSGEAK